MPAVHLHIKVIVKVEDEQVLPHPQTHSSTLFEQICLIISFGVN